MSKSLFELEQRSDCGYVRVFGGAATGHRARHFHWMGALYEGEAVTYPEYFHENVHHPHLSWNQLHDVAVFDVPTNNFLVAASWGPNFPTAALEWEALV